ncbi:FeoB-associated Cys-rich membrane protein [Gallibacterium anatis]|nr:FeoB-associated Cys-rich membrane protein [Gallibacterium anatis]UZD15997.1 FeoB-associated Cys-rich membrane protein [Gallibacterium anatis]
MIQYLIVIALFIGAVGYLITNFRKKRQSGCGDCCRCGSTSKTQKSCH